MKKNIKRYFEKISWIIIGILLTQAYHYITQKPDVSAVLEPFTRDDYGAFFPVKIINTGDKTLTNLHIYIKTCYMHDFKELNTIPELKKRASENLRFWDEKTISMLPKKLCLTEYNFSFNDCYVEFYILNSTSLSPVESECSIYLCDFCPYTIKITSNEFKEEKIFTHWFIAPKEIKMAIKNPKKHQIDKSNLSKFSTSIAFNLFTSIEFCLYDANCSFMNFSSTIEDKEYGLYRYLFHNMYPLNISVTNQPNTTKYNFSNVTFLVGYTDEQEQEIMEKGFNINDFTTRIISSSGY